MERGSNSVAVFVGLVDASCTESVGQYLVLSLRSMKGFPLSVARVNVDRGSFYPSCLIFERCQVQAPQTARNCKCGCREEGTALLIPRANPPRSYQPSSQRIRGFGNIGKLNSVEAKRQFAASFRDQLRTASNFIDNDAELDGNKLAKARHAAPINRTGRTRINNVVIQGNDAARTRRRPWTALQDRINALPRVRLNAGSKPSGTFTGPRACRMGVPADHRPLMKAMQVSVWKPNGFHSYAELLGAKLNTPLSLLGEWCVSSRCPCCPSWLGMATALVQLS